jgi:hypothetical protein
MDLPQPSAMLYERRIAGNSLRKQGFMVKLLATKHSMKADVGLRGGGKGKP